MGKEAHVSKLTYLYRFYKYCFLKRKEYSSVFVHMNPIYVILGGLFWKLLKRKIMLWYTHKNVDLKLRVSEKIVDVICSASKESFRLQTPKLHVVGHGINVSNFIQEHHTKNVFTIVSIGRISKVKNWHILVEALAILKPTITFKAFFVGGPISTEDKVYYEYLKELIAKKGLQEIELVGSVPYHEVGKYLQQASVTVNVSHTGSLDKVILEAMATGVPVITSNEGAKTLLADFASTLLVQNTPEAIAKAIERIYHMPKDDLKHLSQKLQAIVAKEHSLQNLIPVLIKLLEI